MKTTYIVIPAKAGIQKQRTGFPIKVGNDGRNKTCFQVNDESKKIKVYYYTVKSPVSITVATA